MRNKQQHSRFDVAIWRGPTDVRAASVRVGMMFGLGLMWLGLIGWILSST